MNMNNLRFAVFLLACLFGFQSLTVQKGVKSATDYEVVAKDAAWCWFSDPRAVYHKGNHERIYYGYINSKGDVLISSRDVNSGAIQTFVLHEKLQIDDHNVPTILFLPDGKMIAFYNEHSGNVFMRKSINAEDITAWEDEVTLTFNNNRFCYTNPVMLSEENNRIYIFGRQVGKGFTQWWQYYSYSDDLGKTWKEDKIYLDNKNRDNPPYLKITSDNKSRIDVLFTDGHPKIGPDVSVFHMYYEKGNFHQTNGEILGPINGAPIEIAKVNKIYDASQSQIRGWIWDIALDKNKRPVVTYSRYPSENDHRYYYAFWDGSKWIDQEISKSGGWMPSLKQGDRVQEAHYSGGVVLDHQDPSNVYLSRQIEGYFEIEHKRWNGKKWKTTPVTGHSTINNIRPYVVDGNANRRPILLWMTGFYNHYTIYNTDLRIKE